MGLSEIRNKPVIEKINDFLVSPSYILSLMVLTALANLFSLELAVYTLFVAVALYTAVLGRDLLPWVPLVVCGYLAPSEKSNPGKYTDSIFRSGHGAEYVLVLAVLVFVAVGLYILRNPKGFFKAKRRFLWGLLALSGAYLLGGLMSPAQPKFTEKNLTFAALQAGTLLVPYYVISGGVRWEKAPKDFLCQTGFGVGCLLLVQILGIYLSGDVVEKGVIVRDRIFTGWGMHNNIGGMLAMMLPFAFGVFRNRRWLGTVMGAVFLAGVCLTSSRSSMMAGGVIYVVCVLAQLKTKQGRSGCLIALGGIAAVVAILALIFRQELSELFTDILDRGTSLNYRDEIWKEGFKQFKKYPVFGGGFFPIGYVPYDFSTVADFSGFFPPRWHNTLVQLLASTGLVGVLAYGFHRFQTVWALVKNRTRQNAFIGAYFLVMVATCLFDCHFFNIGPVLFYAMVLAFAERE